MARRNKRTRGRPRRTKTRTSNQVRVPFVQEVIEGKTAVFSYQTIFGFESDNSIYKNVPWRVKSLFIELARSSDVNDPAIVQIRLNSAASVNVESIVSHRCMVVPGSVVRRRLRMRGPNLWKEEEQKTQNILEIDNIKFGTDVNMTKIAANMILTFEFGSLNWKGYDSLLNRGRIVDRPGPSSAASTPYSIVEDC